MQRHIKTFESFNEGLLQKAVDFVKDPSGKKREAAAAEERDNANRAERHAAEEERDNANRAERKAELNRKEDEYRSTLSPEQLKKLEDQEEGEYRAAMMVGEPAPDYLGQDGYFRHYHTNEGFLDR